MFFGLQDVWKKLPHPTAEGLVGAPAPGFTWRGSEIAGMSDQQSELAAAFGEAGYTVEDVTTNRNQVRVVLREEDAEGERLKEIVTGTMADEKHLGTNVTTESAEGGNEMVTVVTIRRRP